MNLATREDSPLRRLSETRSEIRRDNVMYKANPPSPPLPSASDRNHCGGLVVSRNSRASASTTTSGVIVAGQETNRGNSKKPCQPTSTSFERKDFYAKSSGANSNSTTTSRRLVASTPDSPDESKDNDKSIWERRHQKSASQDSIVVQQTQIDQSPQSSTGDDDDLVSSTLSTTSTVIKRFDNPNKKNVASVLIDQRPRSDSCERSMNDLPSYELASAYIKGNAYAQIQMSAKPSSTTAASMTYSMSNHGHSYDKINQYDQSPTTPGSASAPPGGPLLLGQAQQRHSHLARESSLEPIGEEERLVQITQAVMNSQPPRSKRAEVLRYFAAAKAFQIRVVAGDIQITDSDGCPLFDAYQELDCRQRWWNIEAYGDRVLLMREELSFGDGASSWGARVTITDWNGELFGYLITGDPMRIESVERVGIARFSSQPALVNNAACSNATTVPKACWLCQTGAADDGREQQQVARLEAYQKLVFLGDGNAPNVNAAASQQHANFHLKLMALAGVIRIVGSLTVTPVSDCLALTKFFCNCCAYK